MFLNNRLYDKSLFKHPQKLKLYFKIQFYGNESFRIRKKLNKLISKYYPQVKSCIVFTTGKRLWNIFKFKDSVDDSLVSSLIYKLDCNR